MDFPFFFVNAAEKVLLVYFHIFVLCLFEVENISRDYDLPGVSGDQGGIGGMLSISSLNHIIYGMLIAAFLLLEPRGIAGIWIRIKTYFKTWPFSY